MKQSTSWGPHTTPKEMLEFVRKTESAFEADESGIYVVRLTESKPGGDEIAGIAELSAD